MKNLYLLFGKTHTGKTTRLYNWVSKQKNADGVLAPVIDDKRYLKHIKSGKQKLLEANDLIPENRVLEVGQYRFDNEIFEWAKQKLLDAANESTEWIIIDEFGHLEMRGKGLEPVITEIIRKYRNDFSVKILIVIRESLVQRFLEKYDLKLENINRFEFE